MSPLEARPSYVVVTGKGRSGTTWIARILATHDRCVYKHEPFLMHPRTPFPGLFAELGSGDVGALRARFDAACRSAHAVVDEPLPEQIGMRRLPAELLAPLRRLALRLPALDPVFRLAGRPRLVAGDSVLIKDVNFPNELLGRYCEIVEPRLVAVVRNPFGNIASLMQGADLGALRQPPVLDDVERVLGLLERPELAHLRRFRDSVARMPIASFEALRWRIQTEPLVDFATRHRDARLVVYEQFCRDPFRATEEIFDFVGWKLLQPTRDFIHASTSGPRGGLDPRRAYFSVFRRAQESLGKWKSDLSLEQQVQIAEVVRDSPLRGLWPDLPLPG